MTQTADAIVIGAGPNGLVAANLLADAGWQVVVLEAEDDAGGAVRSAETCEPGFIHDRFSSFYPFAAMSPALRRLDLESHGLRWRRAPAALAHVRPDGSAALLTQDLDETVQRLERQSRGDGHSWRLLAERWTRLEPGIARAFFTPFAPVVGSARIALATDPRDLVRLARFMALPARRLGDEYFAGRDGPLLSGMALQASLAPDDVGSGAFGWIMCGLAQAHGLPVPQGGASMLSSGSPTTSCGAFATGSPARPIRATGRSSTSSGTTRRRARRTSPTRTRCCRRSTAARPTLNRAINAPSTTLRDQRPAAFDAARFQSIVDGSLGGERKLVVRPLGGDRGRLTGSEGSTLASIGRRDGAWTVRREVAATASGWALPAMGGDNCADRR